MKAFRLAAGVIALQLGVVPIHAQNAAQPAAPASPAAPAALADVLPLKVVVTLSRFDGDRRVSSLPYTLSVNANTVGGRDSTANLRMGTQVPVPTALFTPTASTSGKDTVKPPAPFTYHDVGTNIDLMVRRMDAERFFLGVTVSDSSVVDDKAKSAVSPSFRTFSISNQVVLKDGQSTQFSTAPDKVTGEIVKIDVSLNIVK
jgi:hypothetical protein